MSRIIFRVALILLCSILVIDSIAQKKPSKIVLLNERGVTVELKYSLSKKPCGINARRSFFDIYITGSGGIFSLNPFLSWEMEVVNCDTNIVRIPFSINLTTLKEGLNKDGTGAWEFEGDQIEKDPFNIKNTAFENIGKSTIISMAKPTKPEKIVGTKDVMTGTDVVLTLKGGNLPRDAKWVWYSGSCGGSPIGEGVSVTVKPLKTTAYYVRGEGKLMSDCVSFTITVDNDSRPAEEISGKSKICRTELNKQPITLTRLGGKLGYQAQWIWYEGSCGTNKIAEGEDFITVMPTKTTTYSLRAEGPTINPSVCISKTIEVIDPSVKASSISANRSVICEGEPVILTPVGGKLTANAQWQWRSVIDGNFASTIEISGGATLQATPDATTTYFVKATDGFCPDTDETKVTVKVKPKSVQPNGIVLTNTKKRKFTATLDGGVLGSNANWIWHMNDSENKAFKKSETSSISFKARKKDKSIWVKGEGECNTTLAVSEQIYLRERTSVKRKRYGVINFGIVADGKTEISNFVGTLGSHKFFIRGKMGTPAGKYEGNSLGQISNIGNASYSLTGNKYALRKGYTLGFMFGGGFKFYLGAGYGQYQELLEANVTSNGNSTIELVKNMDDIIQGPEGEAGFFIKMGPLNLMFGGSFIYDYERSKQFIDGNVGLGFCL